MTTLHAPHCEFSILSCSTDTFVETRRCTCATLGRGERRRAKRSAVKLVDRAARGFAELLTPDGYNPKTKKGRARGYSSAILHFAPATLSGLNVCQFASPECRAACLNTAGHGGIALDAAGLNDVQRARIARLNYYRYHRPEFWALLVAAIQAHVRRALKHNLIPVVRLNGTSDLPWERLRMPDARTIFEVFPGIQFYDYTKDPRRAIAWARGEMPANYHLTFSRSEVNDADVRDVLAAGGNVAVVFDCGQKHDHALMPELWSGRRVINGDADDLRFLDPAGVVVGLSAKGRAIGMGGAGFVLATDAPQRCDLRPARRRRSRSTVKLARAA